MDGVSRAVDMSVGQRLVSVYYFIFYNVLGALLGELW